MSHAFAQLLDMTVDAFFAWSAAADGKWQLIDGVPHAMAPSTRSHGSIQAEATRLLGNWLAETRPGWSVVTEGGLVPRVSAQTNYRIPDVVVTCTPDTPGRRDIEAPVLVIEVLSPSDQAQTWMNLWAYASIPSIQEMLLLESESVGARLFRRQSDGSWPTLPSPFGETQLVQLDSIGFEVAVAAFYRTTSLAQP